MKLQNIDIPETSIPEREEILLSLIKDNKYDPILWKQITFKQNSKCCSFYVANDALKIDGIRINTTHKLAQLITDALGLIMPTDKIVDLIHLNCGVKITPCMQPDSVKNGTMSYHSRTVRHSKEIDAKLKGKDTTAIISTVGKHWITHNRLLEKKNWAINYGWHADNAPSISPGKLKLLQSAGGAHNFSHLDYSQIYVPIHPIIYIDGNERNLYDVLVGDGWELFTYEKLKLTCHPQVENNNFYIAELNCNG